MHKALGPNVLIITCSFSPAFRPSSVRAVALANHLDAMGAEVCVLTLSAEDLLSVSPEDPQLISAPGVRVVRVNAGLIRRRLRHVAAPRKTIDRAKKNPLSQLLIPDPYADCILSLVREGIRLVKKMKPSVVVTIAYPWSCHIVGSLLARITGIKWIADYSDPWIHSPASDLHRTVWREWIDAQLERWALHSASRVIVCTTMTRALYLRVFPFLKNSIEVVRFGYGLYSSPTEEPVSFVIRQPNDQRLWIVHTGRIYRGARSPEAFLRALKQLLRSDQGLAGRIVLWLVGEVDAETQGQIERWGLRDIVRTIPWVPRSEVTQWIVAADWLLLLGNRGGVQVPSKLYEYLEARKPVLFLQEAEQDEVAWITRAVDAGWVVPNKEEQITEFLQAFSENRVLHPSFQGTNTVEEFSAQAAFQHYWDILKHIA